MAATPTVTCTPHPVSTPAATHTPSLAATPRATHTPHPAATPADNLILTVACLKMLSMSKECWRNISLRFYYRYLNIHSSVLVDLVDRSEINNDFVSGQIIVYCLINLLCCKL